MLNQSIIVEGDNVIIRNETIVTKLDFTAQVEARIEELTVQKAQYIVSIEEEIQHQQNILDQVNN